MGFAFCADKLPEFMKPKRTKLQARFGAERRFEVAAAPAVPFRGTRETELEQFKNRLLRAALEAVSDVDLYAPLRRAANEAAAVVWMTPFPLLFLPALFDEKVAAAQRHFERARSIRSRSRRLLSEVS